MFVKLILTKAIQVTQRRRRTCSRSIVAILTTAEPLVAIALGAGLLGERLTAIQVVGGGLILLAVVGLLSWQARQSAKSAQEMSGM